MSEDRGEKEDVVVGFAEFSNEVKTYSFVGSTLSINLSGSELEAHHPKTGAGRTKQGQLDRVCVCCGAVSHRTPPNTSNTTTAGRRDVSAASGVGDQIQPCTRLWYRGQSESKQA